MIYLVNHNVKWLPENHMHKSQLLYQKEVITLKINLNAKEICVENAFPLLNFAKTILSLKFTEDPNYGLMKHYLIVALMNKNEIPNNIYDWNNKLIEHAIPLKPSPRFGFSGHR